MSNCVADVLIGKTIASTQWEVNGSEGYDDLQINFTDGTTAFVRYSCMGGVFLDSKKESDV